MQSHLIADVSVFGVFEGTLANAWFARLPCRIAFCTLVGGSPLEVSVPVQRFSTASRREVPTQLR